MLSTAVDLVGDVVGLIFIVLNQAQTFIGQMVGR